MMLKGGSDVSLFRIFFIIAVFEACVAESRSHGANITLSAEACYGNINNYLRLECEGRTVIKVLEVFQGAKLKSSKCVTPASTGTYRKMCCQPEKTDCRFQVDNVIGKLCDGNSHCYHLAMWSRAGNQCDQDVYPLTITYNQAFYTCVPLVLATQATKTTTTTTTKERIAETTTLPVTAGTTKVPAETTKVPAETTKVPATKDDDDDYTVETTETSVETTTDTSSANISLTSMILSVVSHDDRDESLPETTERDTESIALNDAIVVAVVSGILGMFFTLVIFIFYWRRKRRLRINGKPQATVWDYLLSQTFTVRGERGYDHFSSCRSSASSDGDSKSPVIRKTFWLPNISPLEDTQSDVFNDSESTNHKLEFHQLGSSNPYAFLTLGVNSSPSGPHHDA